MGYEVKVIIGTPAAFAFDSDNGKKYFSIIAEYDLCVVNLAKLNEWLEKNSTKILAEFGIAELIPIFYSPIGSDGKVDKDAYDKELVAFKVEHLLLELRNQMLTSDYRRYPPLIALLESMRENWGEQLYVVLYGH